jgi:hypothetical protein
MAELGFDAPAGPNTDAVVTLPDARAPQALTVLYSLDVDAATRFVVTHGGVEVDFHYVKEGGPFTYHYSRWTPGLGELKFTLEAAVGAKGTVRVERREDT